MKNNHAILKKCSRFILIMYLISAMTGCTVPTDSMVQETKQSETKHRETITQETVAQESDTLSTSDFIGYTVQCSCQKSRITEPEIEQGDAEFVGSFWLEIEQDFAKIVQGDCTFSEHILSEIEKTAPVTKLPEGYTIAEFMPVTFYVYDEEYKYSIDIISIIDEEKKPSFTLPEGWDYRFALPEIRSFKTYDEDGCNTIDADSGEFFGYDDKLASGCSSYCGCYLSYYTANASSKLEPQGNVTYEEENLTSPRRTNAWAEGVAGDGIGETIEIRELYRGTGDSVFRYNEICIVNGYAKNEKTWQENNRVKSLKLYFMDEYMGTITLEDTMLPQYIDLSPVGMKVGNGCEAKFRFEITEVYEGTKYEDTCLSGIILEFEGRYAH